jgi:formylglycine-generating enzyme required for sulfatase activity
MAGIAVLDANAWKLRDMLGNLYEWVQDCSGYYPQREVTNPVGPEKGEKRLFRGRSWNHYGTMCRAARRFEEMPTIRLNCIGFRVALRWASGGT